MIRFIFVVLFVVLFLILSTPLMLVEWIIGKFNPGLRDRSSLAIVNWAFRWVIRLAGTKVIAIGEENIPRDTAVLYVGNHRSFFDVVLTYVRVPIIPMTIVNSAAIFEDHFPKIKKATVVIEYGKPIYPKDLDKETRKSMGTYVQHIISETYFKNKELI